MDKLNFSQKTAKDFCEQVLLHAFQKTGNPSVIYKKLAKEETLVLGALYERLIHASYSAILQAGDVAIDGGAHRGQHTFPLAKIVGPKGKVFAFEAIPECVDALSKKARTYKKIIQLEPKALAQKIGKKDFFIFPHSFGYSGLKPNPLVSQKPIVSRVSTTTLDAAIGLQLPVKFIKLDLEGGEFHALLGAKKILSKKRPVIAFEFGRAHSARLFGFSKKDFFSYFKKMNYCLFDIFGHPFTDKSWHLEAVPWNLLAIPSEKLPELSEPLAASLYRALRESFK